MEKEVDYQQLINFIRKAENVDKDPELAKVMGVSYNVLKKSLEREAVRFDLIYQYCVNNEKSMDEILGLHNNATAHKIPIYSSMAIFDFASFDDLPSTLIVGQMELSKESLNPEVHYGRKFFVKAHETYNLLGIKEGGLLMVKPTDKPIGSGLYIVRINDIPKITRIAFHDGTFEYKGPSGKVRGNNEELRETCRLVAKVNSCWNQF